MTLMTRPLITDTEEAGSAASQHLFFDRELSWLAFNERVLMQAELEHNPLAERLRFIAISSNNSDEFYMVRLAGLYQLKQRGYHHLPESDGHLPDSARHLPDSVSHPADNEVRLDDVIACVEARASDVLASQQRMLKGVLADLEMQGFSIITPDELNSEQLVWLESWFDEHILPLLSPITLDPTHPFPFIQNKGKGLIAELQGEKRSRLVSVITIPEQLDRFVMLPETSGKFIPVEQIILKFMDKLYLNMQIKHAAAFRVLRDSEIEIDDEAEDLVNQFEDALKRRRRGNIVSLSLSGKLTKNTLKMLCREMELPASRIQHHDGFIGLGDFSALVSQLPKRLKYPAFSPRFPQRIVDFKGDCFAAIKNKDIIVHHPFESFDVVVRFLEQAADDPDVLAIRQTLYRTTPHSPIAQALIRAAENGKTVIALIELKARFDEENNIQLARMLERAGAQVVYGLVDLKVHSKLSHIIRREGGKLTAYTHCGTGNYHPVTAKIYTDLSYFTCDAEICDDVRRIFSYLTSYVEPEHLSKLIISPKHSVQWLTERIDAEIEHAQAGRKGRIWIKTNAIVDHRIITHLYKASQAGVKIFLLVRGICCLRPGIKGLSEHITVKSIIGRYLEHGRIYAFGNGEEIGTRHTDVFIASADLMPRNLYRRVESYIPLENATVRQQILGQVIAALEQDKTDSWLLQPDGSYVKQIETEDDKLSAHAYFMTNPSLSGQGSLAKKKKMP